MSGNSNGIIETTGKQSENGVVENGVIENEESSKNVISTVTQKNDNEENDFDSICEEINHDFDHFCQAIDNNSPRNKSTSGDVEQRADEPFEHRPGNMEVEAVHAADQDDDPSDNNNEKSNLNGYYGNIKGLLATFSLLCNAGLMVYAHVGLSAVVLSSQAAISDDFPPNNSTTNATGLCNANDLIIWEQEGGKVNRSVHSTYCSIEYNGGCLLTQECIAECFATTYGYSVECATCFAAVPLCSLNNGCAGICAADSLGMECQVCNEPCTRQLDNCTGFPDSSSSRFLQQQDEKQRLLQEQDDDECLAVDLESIEQWYAVYNLTFVDSINKAWNGDAKGLAVLVVLFSGIWPYAKNIVLVYVWYRKMTVERRTSVLTWLLRLSKYTLVDVFAVMCILIGVQLELFISGRDVVVRAEPRPAIIAFFVATLWEFTQIEWTVHLHNRHVDYGNESVKKDESNERTPEEEAETSPSSCPSDGNLLMAMRFRTKPFSNKSDDCVAPTSSLVMWGWIVLLLVATLALYLSGSITELIRFTTFGVGGTVGCEKSYNLVTFGNAMLSELALTDNSALPATWTLYIAYVLLVLALPIAVHLLQIIILTLAALSIDKKSYRRACKVSSSLFGFSSVEVLLIGIFAIEYRFESFVAALAGNANSEFFTITSGLGPAFFVLIGYSFASGFLQYFLHCAESEYYKIDPYHKVNAVWTLLFRPWLEKKKQ